MNQKAWEAGTKVAGELAAALEDLNPNPAAGALGALMLAAAASQISNIIDRPTFLIIAAQAWDVSAGMTAGVIGK